jgi:Fe2+ transport system protein FeoA
MQLQPDAVTLKNLKPGQKARITGLAEDSSVAHHLGELGLLKGQEIELVKTAPLGDPLSFRIMDYELCLRQAEAELVAIEILP